MSDISTIERNFNGKKIKQRKSDGYLNASDMCKAVGKRWPDYRRLDNVQEFLDALSLDTKIPVVQIPTTEQNQGLIETIQGGAPDKQGTWVHPRVAVNLAQWCSPEFAVLVSEWVVELLTTGRVELAQPVTTPTPARLDGEITLAKAAAEMLRMSDDSKLKMLYQIGSEHQLSTTFLPDYTESRPTQALTMLLKEHNVGLSAAKANKILLELGILETKSRESTKVPGRINA